MNPSDFTQHPYSSVLSFESEKVARNIMVILKRTGNKFRNLTFDEYKQERVKDGNFSVREKTHFDQVIDYCISSDKAREFSPNWD